MKFIKNIISSILLAINIILLVALIVSAYASYLHPSSFPHASCLGLGFPILGCINVLSFILCLLFRWKLTIIPFIGFLLTFTQYKSSIAIHRAQEVPEGTVKLLTYNTMSMGNRNKDLRKNTIIRYLIDSKADIICLQEFNFPPYLSKTMSPAKVNRILKPYPYSKRIQVGNEHSNNHVAVYSKYPILDGHKIKTSKSLYNGSALFHIKLKSDTITLINCHLESNKLTHSDKTVYKEILKTPDGQTVKQGASQLIHKLSEASVIRSRQIEAISKEIQESTHPVIVCGDFNDTPVSFALNRMRSVLTDAFAESGKGLGISYNQNKFYFRIDHILHDSHFKSYNCTVDRSIETSDHFPVWCFLQKL